MITGLARFRDNVCPLTWDYGINCTQKNTDNDVLCKIYAVSGEASTGSLL